ncbi:hypothetical protein [Curtobacterium sp. MCPF17_052]|uniref:hypothetical protein n=1 Tax=Curtobacterium sp. MCPF17_052 TaxID=2175655 RepID=UPI0024DF42D0|nr:hypothetical protein [Curtobacterium sp. MCPF17_052]WIB12514.1 hypothetical protein DEJ36_18115 [Curtobacterium sp. MCPF17_052]
MRRPVLPSVDAEQPAVDLLETDAEAETLAETEVDAEPAVAAEPAAPHHLG